MRRVAFGVVGRWPLASSFLFELVEKPVQVLTVKHQATALSLSYQKGSPYFIERATFDADIGHGFLV